MESGRGIDRYRNNRSWSQDRASMPTIGRKHGRRHGIGRTHDGSHGTWSGIDRQVLGCLPCMTLSVFGRTRIESGVSPFPTAKMLKPLGNRGWVPGGSIGGADGDREGCPQTLSETGSLSRRDCEGSLCRLEVFRNQMVGIRIASACPIESGFLMFSWYSRGFVLVAGGRKGMDDQHVLDQSPYTTCLSPLKRKWLAESTSIQRSILRTALACVAVIAGCIDQI